jgi:hypothetical protein
MKDIPLSRTWGLDIWKDYVSGENEVEVFERNCGEGQAMAAGPSCRFNGKNVPCFVGVSLKASITAELLL